MSKLNLTLLQILSHFNLNLSTNPRGTDKGDYKSYVTEFYEKEFSKFRKENIRLLEIGVRSGASLTLWANYFENIEIIGLDISEIDTPIGPVKEYIDYSSIKFYCKDAYSMEVANSISGKFQILIDDGPHSLTSQIRFLELYLNKLDNNGVLIIEDILFGYRDCYHLMKSLPKGNKYLFEIYDFENIKKGGGFLFVVRHNSTKKHFLFRKLYVIIRSFFELLNVLFGRLKRGDFSFRDRRVNH